MNFTILAAGLLLVLPNPEISRARVAHSIALREGWDGHSIGAADERGRYQFKPATWFRFSHKPLFWAESSRQDCLAEQDRVARRVISEAITRLPSMGMPVSPYTIALAWNAGLGAVERREIPVRAFEFAAAVRALYEDPNL